MNDPQLWILFNIDEGTIRYTRSLKVAADYSKNYSWIVIDTLFLECLCPDGKRIPVERFDG
jgi:hypothetical protein